jgi:trk system potassium uptake protein
MSIESLNRALYGSKEAVYKLLKLLSYISTLGALALILYGYGFELSTKKYEKILFYLDFVFLFFILNYAIRILYSFERIEFVKRTWFEGFLMALLGINLISIYVLDNNIVENLFKNIGITDYIQFSQLFISGYMFLMAFLEFAKVSSGMNRLKIKPATTFIFSFLILITVGVGILMLPAITVAPGGLSFTDALFMSVSACCVTGLSVLDVAKDFSFKGHLILLILVQLGGLGIVTFATFFASFIKKGISMKHDTIFQELMSPESLLDNRSLLRQIMFITFLIESCGAVVIFFSWGPNVVFESLGDKIFNSIFHAVSAFCNAGFSTFSNSLYELPLRQMYILHLMFIPLIFLGGIGFSTIKDIFSIKKLRERLHNPWKDWKLSSKLAVYTSVILIVFGTVMFFIIERNYLLKDMKLLEGIIASFFQSVTSRTAGFNSVDISMLQTPTLILIIFLMFVGASPGSCGGGIKTTTFVLIFISTITTIRQKKNFEIGKRSISPEQMYKALSIFTFAATFNLVAIFILSITDSKFELIRLVFEQISAFGTVGLSTGITADLSAGGKIMIMVSMFIGRVGLLTLALSLSTRSQSTSYKYPNANLLVA